MHAPIEPVTSDSGEQLAAVNATKARTAKRPMTIAFRDDQPKEVPKTSVHTAAVANLAAGWCRYQSEHKILTRSFGSAGATSPMSPQQHPGCRDACGTAAALKGHAYAALLPSCRFASNTNQVRRSVSSMQVPTAPWCGTLLGTCLGRARLRLDRIRAVHDRDADRHGRRARARRTAAEVGDAVLRVALRTA